MIFLAQDLIYFHWLKELFNNLLKTPFEIPDDDGSDITRAFFNAEREGLLTKEGVHFLFINDPSKLHLSMADQGQRRPMNILSSFFINLWFLFVYFVLLFLRLLPLLLFMFFNQSFFAAAFENEELATQYEQALRKWKPVKL